ncbi:MAG TPA: nitrile hydratase subunit beta [Steroidobacteraceae bacterium]|jgi:nitrile hydratase|nr:nitrile hydratase subunit beta [Steroidobacteraceae bacterium]
MNGVHDLGGMHGMGAIQEDKEEPVFHAPWEARAYAVTRAMGGWRMWSLDAARYQRELIAPVDYFQLSYYERWIAALMQLMLDRNLVTRTEIESGKPDQGTAMRSPALTADKVPMLIAKGVPARRDVAVTAHFQVGQHVRARNINPSGHTRLPRYTRGKLGTIEQDHGVFVFPDTNAHSLGEKPQHVYSVRFRARALWGEQAADQDSVYVDLWDDYLESA